MTEPGTREPTLQELGARLRLAWDEYRDCHAGIDFDFKTETELAQSIGALLSRLDAPQATEILDTLKQVHEFLRELAGSAMLSGDDFPEEDRGTFYSESCKAMNNVAWLIDELSGLDAQSEDGDLAKRFAAELHMTEVQRDQARDSAKGIVLDLIDECSTVTLKFWLRDPDEFRKAVIARLKDWRVGEPEDGDGSRITRFAEFDDESHPFQKWWVEHGQYMMSGGGYRARIWSARGWIAREQLMCGVEVTGESLRETEPSAPPSADAKEK